MGGLGAGTGSVGSPGSSGSAGSLGASGWGFPGDGSGTTGCDSVGWCSFIVLPFVEDFSSWLDADVADIA